MQLFGLSEPTVRLIAFAAIFLSMAAFELFSPRLERDELMGAVKAKRWFTNLSILVISSLALRVVFPLAAVGTALWAQENGYGLFALLGTPAWIAGIIAFVILDFAVWLEHVASHKFHILWRIHRMHHCDPGFDVTTALRFHPLEILISMVWKALIILALGPPAIAVLVFEIVLNGTAMFNHSNVKLPLPVDRLVRLVLVTPDMHRVHHSSDRRETDTNYGFNFPFWDRIFRTYCAQPRLGHRDMDIGLKDYRDNAPTKLGWSLLLPFRK
ncbi:sterol desaturase family protein [Hoeflea poritis]|uniref:Sterol desaturase family protein n=1 Tax=Hoeflea poritis TaxID=2993659 RepID=A0ABT4VTN4_9HYPH|nr:sterol desaturase family protein [Hoeflea poritis]MDA4848051.1 sterol desaturase family protein [Hoeflea poritis]